jgi:predicted class III extradiol MEMO1 family dioxygenase
MDECVVSNTTTTITARLTLLQELLDAQEHVRRQSGEALVKTATDSPQEIEPKIPELLSLILQSTDDMVIMQIAHACMLVCERIPGSNKKYSEQIMATLEHLSSRVMSEDDSETIIIAASNHLFNTQVQILISDSHLLEKSFPLIFKYLNKKGAARWPAYRIVTSISFENPKLLESYTGEVIDLVVKGSKELSASLMHLYKIKPEAFHSRLDKLVQLYQTDSESRSLLLSVFTEMSRGKPELLVPHLDLFVEGLTSPASASMATVILSRIARNNPDIVYPHLGKIQRSLDHVDALRFTAPQLLGLIGRLSEDVAREILPFLAELLKDADQNLAIIVLSEFRNLGQMNQELLVPYMDLIRRFAEDPQQHVRDQANLIIDIMEGRDLRSLAAQIEEQNALIKEAALTMDSLKEYVDKNVELLKTFIGDVVKKLPIPIRFSTEGRVRNTLQLQYVCGIQNAQCLYPLERPFVTETKEWGKWLRIAMSAVSIGKAVIFPFETSEAVESVRKAYSLYKTGEEQEMIKDDQSKWLLLNGYLGRVTEIQYDLHQLFALVFLQKMTGTLYGHMFSVLCSRNHLLKVSLTSSSDWILITECCEKWFFPLCENIVPDLLIF